MNSKYKFKKGAASFYIVAFSTLILLIVATSFAAVIISEVTRTSNDDLSQSAYDSALAGVEDAKLAYYNYQNCLAQGVEAGSSVSGFGPLDCSAIMYYIQNPEGQDCDMVANMLGRKIDQDAGGVIVSEVDVSKPDSVSNNMQQAYTCTKIQTILGDYRARLSSSKQTKVAKIKFADNEENPMQSIVNSVERIEISWYDDEDKTDFRYKNFSGGKVVFPQSNPASLAVPPTISVAMVQTGPNFSLSDFDVTRDAETNRGMVYLVPVGDETVKSKYLQATDTYVGAYDGTKNYIKNMDASNNRSGFLKSNDKTKTNLPYAVYCPEDSGNEFACSVTIDLPRPIGGMRNEDTFMIAVSLPYGKPSTNFSLKFWCADGTACYSEKKAAEGTEIEETTETSQAYLDGVQISIDSTGRANDLYRRVESRLESETNNSYLTIGGALELLGSLSDGSGGSGSGSGNFGVNTYLLDKDYGVTCEYDFDATCSR